MYSPYGIHELQNADNAWLAALSPQVMVHSGTVESADVMNRHRARGMELVALLPNTVIGMRWWPDDNVLLKTADEWFGKTSRPANWWTDSSICDSIAERYANRFFPLHVPGTILMVGNEDDPNNYVCTVALHTAVCRIGTARRVPLGLCCTSMGNPSPDKYGLLKPLFDEMARGRADGVVHWWRPNTYSPLPIDANLVQQHVREAKKLGNFPPTFYGEFSFVNSLSEADKGPLFMGLSPQTFKQKLIDAQIPVPCALYCEGDGIYGSQWKYFNLKPYHDMLLTLPKVPLTAYDQWKQAHVTTPVSPTNPTSLGVGKMIQDGVRVRNAPNTSGDIVVQSKLGDRLEVFKDSQVRESDGYSWVFGKYPNGTQGWFAWEISRKLSWQVDTPVVVKADLNLIYVSQLGNLQNNDCGQACALSAVLTRLRNVGYGNFPILNLKTVLIALNMPDKATSVAQMQNVFGALGVEAHARTMLTPTQITNEVTFGSGVMVLVNYVIFDPAQRFGHWVMIDATTEDGGFLVNDPYGKNGERVYLTAARLEVGLTDQKNKDGSSFASIPYQGFVLKLT